MNRSFFPAPFSGAFAVKHTDGLMELKINSAIGSMDEQIDIEKSGKDLMIGFKS